MKFPGPLENQRLSFLLEKAISREAQMWKVNVPKMPTNQNVSPSQRDEVIQWLAKLKYQFNLYPETFALASSLLDRFLATVKAHPKYLSCIAISCFFLAAKTVEEDERIPVLKVLARDSFCGCSSSEILRMERIILDKLNWDLHTATPLDFLHIFHAIAVSTRPQLLFSLPRLSPSQHLAVLTKQLLHCMACNQLLQFKGSMLALAMVSLEMEKLIPDWLPLTIELLQKAQMESSQLIHCRELVAHHLSSLQSSLPLNSVYVYRPLKHTLVTCDKGVFRLQPSSVPGPDLGFSKDNSKPEVPRPGGASRRLPSAKWRKWKWMTSTTASSGSTMKIVRQRTWVLSVALIYRGRRDTLPLVHLCSQFLSCNFECRQGRRLWERERGKPGKAI
ncbi:unnamed protein product [Gulo gulo]|uniref:Cyclin-G1 n=3 Tax=Mustelidae TaxID=9655 RepID=A0A9X9MAC2_GULGU|nr:unnamed protein product [Gulo gulo]